MVISKVRDNSFKIIFSEPELFAQFLKNYVPVEILKDVTPEDIEDITERFLPLFQDNKDSDTIKKVNLKNHLPLFVIAILEHESSVNYRASFKMLQYITLVLAEYEKEANKENKNASVLKGFKYPPVLPLIFFDGTGEWTAETNFFDKTELNDVFHKYIPKFEYELVNLNDYSRQELIRFGDTLSLIMLIDQIHETGRINLLSKLPEDYVEQLQLNTPLHLKKILADIITVLLKRINVPDKEIEEVTEKIYKRSEQNMFAWADNYDVQETRRIAREEEREKVMKEAAEKAEQEKCQMIKKAEEEKRRMIIDMKNEGLKDEVIAKIVKLPIEEVREICP